MSRHSGRVVAAVAIAGLLTLTTTAAGYPTKKVSATRWANSVCSAMGNWLEAVKQNSADVQQAAQEAQTSTDVTAITASFESLFANAGDETRTLAKAIKAAGYPDTPKGRQAQAALVKGFTKFAAAFDTLSARAGQLPRSGAQSDFLTQLTSLQTDSQRRMNDFDKYFGKLDKLDPGHRLKKAFKRAASCRAMNG